MIVHYKCVVRNKLAKNLVSNDIEVSIQMFIVVVIGISRQYFNNNCENVQDDDDDRSRKWPLGSWYLCPLL